MNNSGPQSYKIVSETPPDSHHNSFSDHENKLRGQSVVLARETDMQQMSTQMAPARSEGFVALCKSQGVLKLIQGDGFSLFQVSC